MLCRTPTQFDNTRTASVDTIYNTTYNKAALFVNFKDTFKTKHKFNDVFEKFLSAEMREIL